MNASDNAPTIISKPKNLRPGGADGFANLLRGRRLAHFELEEPIGVGGMAAVIRARDTHLDRKVALKILPPEMAADPENIQRFENEARSAARLDHENIARVFYCGEDQGLHFIAFEFVEGENLRVLLERRGRIPVAESIHYILQIATGLVHASARGVVHRDIKPSNIIVGENGRAKLVDMGLARSLETRPDQGLTHSGMTLGTFDYISPEQALEPRTADVRSDIYSLGCTLYHMLTGQASVPEGTAARKLHFHQNEAPIDPRLLNPEIPDEVAAIVGRMMAKHPKDRYQRPEFLVQHLLGVAQKLSQETEPRPGGEVLFIDSILPSPPKVRPLAVLSAAGLGLVLLVSLSGPLLNAPVIGPTGSSGRTAQGSPTHGSNPGSSAPLPLPSGPYIEAPLAPDRSRRHAKNAQDLRDIVQGETRGGRITLDSGVYAFASNDSTADESGGELGITGGEWVIQPKDPTSKDPPTIKLTNVSAKPFAKDKDAALLSASGATIIFDKLRFELEPGDGAVPMVLFKAAGATQLVFRDCEFVQKGSTGSDVRLAVLKVLRGTSGNRVEFHRCLLGGGRQGLVLEEGAQLSLLECLIGPYAQPVQIVRANEPHAAPSSLVLNHTSWLLGSGPALLVDSGQPCQVKISNSIISDPEKREGSLFLQMGRDQESRWRFDGENNYYHDLDALIARTAEGGRQEILVERGTNTQVLASFKDQSVWKSQSPWLEANPVKVLAEGQPLKAFLVRTQMAELRPTLGSVLGPRRPLGQDLYPNLEQLPTEVASLPKELIVDGQGDDPGTHENLNQALSDKKSETTVIVLKVNGPVRLTPVDIRTRTVTIRAATGFYPELTLDPAERIPSREDPALFRVHDGALILEHVAVRVTPVKMEGMEDVTWLQSFVTITGSGRCRLKGCLATLEGEGRLSSALITVADPTGMMMGTVTRPAPLGAPVISLEDCFVRGKGDLLSVRGSRPFVAEVKNTLAALDGSFLSVEGNKNDASGAEDAKLILDHVTVYVTQSLIAQRATAANPHHVPLAVDKPTACVFVAERTPLLWLEGLQSAEDVRRRLKWGKGEFKGEKNLYSRDEAILYWQLSEPTAMPHLYDGERWQESAGEVEPRFARSVKFEGFPSTEKTLSEASPGDFEIMSMDPPEPNPVTRGADVDKLPNPASKPAPVPDSSPDNGP